MVQKLEKAIFSMGIKKDLKTLTKNICIPK